MKATAKELRFHSKELLDAVSRGDSVVITFRGKPCAKLVPYEDPKSPESVQSVQDENGLFGIWQDREDIDNVEEYVLKLRQSRF
jgi:prevent-host-death family protein